METKNILVIGIWAFAVVWLVGMLIDQGDMFSALVIFFVAIIVSVVATALPTSLSPKTSSDRPNAR